jgi:hypothetical protein
MGEHRVNALNFRRGTVVLLFAIGSAACSQAEAAAGNVYTCKELNKVRKSDHEFVDCSGVQTITSPSGVVTYLLSPEQLAALQACKDRRASLVAAEALKARTNTGLLLKYPDEAAHQQAREAALEPSRAAIRSSQARLDELQKDHKKLADDGEFYVGKPLPIDLQRKVDANDASIAAQKDLMRNAQAETARITAQMDDQLLTLKLLWSGVKPPPVTLPDCTT